MKWCVCCHIPLGTDSFYLKGCFSPPFRNAQCFLQWTTTLLSHDLYMDA